MLVSLEHGLDVANSGKHPSEPMNECDIHLLLLTFNIMCDHWQMDTLSIEFCLHVELFESVTKLRVIRMPEDASHNI